MEQVIEFVDKARTRYENHPFYERYKDKKLDYIEVVGTFLFNQANIITSTEFHAHNLKLTKDKDPIYVGTLIREEYQKNWPLNGIEEKGKYVQPAVMYACQSYIEHLHTIKEDREKILAHLWALMSEIHRNLKSSVLVEDIEKEFKKAYDSEKREEVLEEVKISWQYRHQLLGDLEAHEEYWQEIKPKVDMFAVAVKEMSADKSGTNNVADGNKDETEDQMVRAGLMANAVHIKTMKIEDVPEDLKKYVQDDLDEKKKKEEQGLPINENS